LIINAVVILVPGSLLMRYGMMSGIGEQQVCIKYRYRSREDYSLKIRTSTYSDDPIVIIKVAH